MRPDPLRMQEHEVCECERGCSRLETKDLRLIEDLDDEQRTICSCRQALYQTGASNGVASNGDVTLLARARLQRA